MTSRRGPPSVSADSCPVFSSIPACRARTAPDRVGSITKHTVSAPMNTHSHQRTEPPGCPPSLSSRGAKTRQVVSSACRCQESRDRAVIASASGASSAPACAQVPASVAGEISAPCRARPVTREFMLRPATYRSVSSITTNPLENSPLPIAFGGPGATTRTITCQSNCCPDTCSPSSVNGSPHSGQPYPPPGKSQNISNRGRCEESRRPALAAGLITAGLSTTSRARTRPLRRPPEQHPLQHRQVSPHPLQLGVPLRNTRQQPGVVLPQPGVVLPQPGVVLPQPGVVLPQPGVLLAKLPGQLHQLPVRLQRGSQRIPQRQVRTRLRHHRSRPSHGAQQI